MLSTVQARGRRQRAGMYNECIIALMSIYNFQDLLYFHDQVVVLIRSALRQKAMIVYPILLQGYYGSVSA